MPDALGSVTGNKFPPTRPSVVVDVKSENRETRTRAFGVLIQAYWKPVYGYLRLKWTKNRDEAEDLTQEFFLQAMERGFFERFAPGRSRFRTFLRTCLDGFVANDIRAAGRIKRGGEVTFLSLDFAGAESDLAPVGSVAGDMDAYFHQEWVRSLFTMAVDSLRAHCEAAGKPIPFALFQRHDMEIPEGSDPPSYRELAGEFGLPVTQVTNHLAYARREFRRIVLARLRELTANDDEFRDETESLLGVRPL